MPDPATIDRLRSSVLSAVALKELQPDWSDAVIDEWLNFLDNFIKIAEILDLEIDKKVEELDTDFTDGSIPYADSGHLAEDNVNLAWDDVNNILEVLSVKITGLTPARLLALDSNGIAENTDIDDWITGTPNQVTVTDDADGTATLSTPQDIDTDADVEFDSLTTEKIKLVKDNSKLYWGAADDASMYYDGTDLNIKTDEVAASDLLLDCGAEKTLELQTVVYDDLQVSISNIRVPASSAPTERLYDHGIGSGVTFPVLGFATGEYIYFDIQSYHAMKLSTVLDNHIHYMTPTDGTGDRFQFQLDVIAAPINGNWAVPTGSPFTKEVTMSADLSNTHKIVDIADIPAVNTTVSTIYKCKLTRIAATTDEYSGEVYLEFSDCHYQKDTMGSRAEAVK